MEVITSISPIHYAVFLILGVISEIIVGAVIFKKIQKCRKIQDSKKHALLTLVSKFEHALLKIQECVEDYKKVDGRSKDLEIDSISGVTNHQLGHISRFRGLLK